MRTFTYLDATLMITTCVEMWYTILIASVFEIELETVLDMF